jgi:hypothetical protein
MPIDPNIAMGVKPIDFLGPAGNYLNLARGAQALQQEQAMNPIQQERARIELGIARDTQQAEIARQKAISGQNVVAEEQARFNQAGNVQERLQQAFAPLFKLDSFQDVTRDPRAAFKDVMAAKQQAIAAGVPPESAEMFSASLYSRIEEALNRKDPTPVKEWEFRNLMSRQTAEAQQRAFAPFGTPPISVAGVPSFVVSTPGGPRAIPVEAGRRPQPQVPAMPQEGAQTSYIPLRSNVITLGPYETGPANKLGAGVPQGQPELIPSQPPVVQPQGVTAEMMSARPVGAAGAMKMPDLPYPVRPKEGGYFFLPNEETDQKAGREYNTALTNLLPDLTINKENLFRVANLATKIEKDLAVQSGPFSAAQRGVEAFFGNPQYKELSKLLANVQLSMLKSGGSSLGTDAGKDLVAKSQGTEMYDPRLLTKIARETLGNVLQKEAEATAANAFIQKYGPQNHNAFKQVWSSNADPKVFEMLAAEKLFPADKNRRLDAYNSILEGVPDTSSNPNVVTKAKLLEKHKAIKSIMQSGSL